MMKTNQNAPPESADLLLSASDSIKAAPVKLNLLDLIINLRLFARALHAILRVRVDGVSDCLFGCGLFPAFALIVLERVLNARVHRRVFRLVNDGDVRRAAR